MAEEQPEVHQSEMSEKFGEDLINDLDGVEFVSQDDDLETEKPEEETPETETDKPEKEEEKSEETTDEFEFVKETDDGKVFDTESAYNFMTTKTEKPLDVKQPVETPKEVEKKEDEPSYEENLEANLKNGVNLIKKYRDAGYDLDTSILFAERDLDNIVKDHLQERMFNEKLSKIDEREKSITEKAELSEAKPKSSQNINDAVKQGNWGTREKLEKALFTRELGGQFLAKQFERENPNKKYNSIDEYTRGLNDWFLKMSADRESLQLAEMVARAAIITRNLPKIIEQAKNLKTKVQTQNKRANVASDKTINRETAKSENELTKWLNNEGL